MGKVVVVLLALLAINATAFQALRFATLAETVVGRRGWHAAGTRADQDAQHVLDAIDQAATEAQFTVRQRLRANRKARFDVRWELWERKELNER
ncbi:MAG: hypothetical protein AB7U73_01995 [Pirellulales bacterium]